MPRLSVTLILLTSVFAGCAAPPVDTGHAPLGATWPGRTPELFAPGVVNTDGIEINLVFNKAPGWGARIEGSPRVRAAKLR